MLKQQQKMYVALSQILHRLKTLLQKTKYKKNKNKSKKENVFVSKNSFKHYQFSYLLLYIIVCTLYHLPFTIYHVLLTICSICYCASIFTIRYIYYVLCNNGSYTMLALYFLFSKQFVCRFFLSLEMYCEV